VDHAALDDSQDIFGREKLPDHLDNRKGAGSYDRDMTTLYVHYGGAGSGHSNLKHSVKCMLCLNNILQLPVSIARL